MVREVRYPLRYGQSLCRKRMTRRIAIDFEGKSSSLDLVFEPYQSILIRVSLGRRAIPRPRLPAACSDELTRSFGLVNRRGFPSDPHSVLRQRAQIGHQSAEAAYGQLPPSAATVRDKVIGASTPRHFMPCT